MERVYSAFFTSERRTESRELTAAALALHNESQNNPSDVPQRVCSSDRDRRRRDGDKRQAESVTEALRHATARRQQLHNLTTDWKRFFPKDLEAAGQAAARAFVLAYGAKAFTAVLLASRKWSSLEYGYADAARLLLRRDTLRFGAFFGTLVGTFRITELAARAARGGQKDAVNLAIAGAVSGSALLLDSPARRKTVSLYMFVRMVDVVCRHLTSIGVLPTWRYSSEMLFAMSNAAIITITNGSVGLALSRIMAWSTLCVSVCVVS
uniref:Transmembrane protein 135 N-terminal domain-containing protein n=1 Tax=Hyaloperonospora arabidopsidis (strain Emoy2) TaxID=559515 RepID=M4BQZ6_HYAAE